MWMLFFSAVLIAFGVYFYLYFYKMGMIDNVSIKKLVDIFNREDLIKMNTFRKVGLMFSLLGFFIAIFIYFNPDNNITGYFMNSCLALMIIFMALAELKDNRKMSGYVLLIIAAFNIFAFLNVIFIRYIQ